MDHIGASLLAPPHGLEEILAAFGEIYDYIGKDGSLDPRWQADFLTRIELPFAMPLAWEPARSIRQMTCHKRLTAAFEEVFAGIQREGLQDAIRSFGGCFAFRRERGGSKLSTHAWGIAVDLNSGTNAQGSAGDMDPGVIAVFREAGFTWGGEWTGSRRDAMHFQFCSGY